MDVLIRNVGLINVMCLLSNPNIPIDMAHIGHYSKMNLKQFAEEGAAVKKEGKKSHLLVNWNSHQRFSQQLVHLGYGRCL